MYIQVRGCQVCMYVYQVYIGGCVRVLSGCVRVLRVVVRVCLC